MSGDDARSREVAMTYNNSLRQFDNLVHTLYAVIHRDLKDRMLFLDPQSRFFRSFIGRIRGFHLPIHLEVKSAAAHPLALRDRLRNGLLRRGWHGYGLARLSRRRCHLMIALDRCDIKPCWRRRMISRRALTRFGVRMCLHSNWRGSQVVTSGLLQIDGLVAAVLVELGAPYFVRALMLGWTKADGRSQPHVEITHGL